MTTTQEPSHVTTVDQHVGDHPTGMREMRLTDVRTRFSDHSQESWDSLTDDAREWWQETLADLHAAEVELAELDCDTRAAAREIIGERCRYGCDLENVAGVIRGAIADAKAAE